MINPDLQKKSPLILVVDEENILPGVAQRFMEIEGYRIVGASNGKQCLDICQRQRPDIVLLDAMMPSVDGFTCCIQLRTLLGDDCPPILMITSVDDQESVNRAFQAGADDLIAKPIHWSTLHQRVSRLLASKSAIAEQRHQIQRECLLTVQLEATHRELQRLVSFDNLTRIGNRRYFNEYSQREWKRLRREQLPLSLILCDVDFFKAYNETYGYQRGDECLRQVANTISSCKRRAADLVTRYGCDQFALLLPNTQAEVAVNVAKAIQACVKAMNIVHAGSPVSECVTLSLGVTSVVPNWESSADELMTKAQTALNQAKLEGRDRMIVLLEPMDDVILPILQTTGTYC